MLKLKDIKKRMEELGIEYQTLIIETSKNTKEVNFYIPFYYSRQAQILFLDLAEKADWYHLGIITMFQTIISNDRRDLEIYFKFS